MRKLAWVKLNGTSSVERCLCQHWGTLSLRYDVRHYSNSSMPYCVNGSLAMSIGLNVQFLILSVLFVNTRRSKWAWVVRVAHRYRFHLTSGRFDPRGRHPTIFSWCLQFRPQKSRPIIISHWNASGVKIPKKSNTRKYIYKHFIVYWNM